MKKYMKIACESCLLVPDNRQQESLERKLHKVCNWTQKKEHTSKKSTSLQKYIEKSRVELHFGGWKKNEKIFYLFSIQNVHNHDDVDSTFQISIFSFDFSITFDRVNVFFRRLSFINRKKVFVWFLRIIKRKYFNKLKFFVHKI